MLFSFRVEIDLTLTRRREPFPSHTNSNALVAGLLCSVIPPANRILIYLANLIRCERCEHPVSAHSTNWPSLVKYWKIRTKARCCPRQAGTVVAVVLVLHHIETSQRPRRNRTMPRLPRSAAAAATRESRLADVAHRPPYGIVAVAGCVAVTPSVVCHTSPRSIPIE